MEEAEVVKLLKDTSPYFVLLAAAITAAGKLISFFSEFLTKEVLFSQKQRHAKVNKKTEIFLQQQEEAFKDSKAAKAVKVNFAKTTARDIQRVSLKLRELVTDYHICRAAIAVYHNGVAKGFRNWSMRYEEVRSPTVAANNDFLEVREVINDYQSKPLYPFYNQIDRFSTESFIIFTTEEPVTEENENVIRSLLAFKASCRIVVPLMIPVKQIKLESQQLFAVERNGEDFFVLGSLFVDFDTHSFTLGGTDGESFSEDKIQSCAYKMVNVADTIVNIYENNPLVLS